MSTLTHTFQALVKDKEIIAAEVMHEYDEKVLLRVFPFFVVLMSFYSLYTPVLTLYERTSP